MEKIDNLLGNLTEIVKDFEAVKDLEAKDIEQSVEILELLFGKLKPIMRFIDQKIQIEYFENENTVNKDYHSENGILLDSVNNNQNTGDYPHADNYGNYDISEVYLTRPGDLIWLIIEGSWSRWVRDSSSWKAHISIITIKDVIENMLSRNTESTYLYAIIRNISRSFESAIRDNENKRDILKSRLDIIESIKELLK